MARSQRGRDKVEKLRRALFRYKWDMAETIIRQIPEGTRLPNIHVDQEQWSVLHVAAMVNAPARLFQKILTVADLEFCMQKDANGQNPLHRLCKGGGDIDAIRILALARPQSLFEMSTSNEGQLIPFEYMLMDEESPPRFASQDIAMLISDIATVWPQGMFMSFAEGESLLHMAIPHCIRRNDLSLAKAILDAAPTLKESTDENGKTPIHHAVHFAVCDKDYPRLGHDVAPLIELLVNNGDESGLDLTDVSGRTPLHEACSKGMQRDVIEILVKKYPGALAMKDDKEMTPLAVFRRRRRRKFQGREVLMAADVAMTLLTGKPLRCSDSPSLHFLLRNENCTMDIVRYLVTAMPGQASVKDENGDLPLHFIFSAQYHDTNSECAGDVVQQLLTAYPDACRITNHDGMLPFELMARSGSDWCRGMRLVFLHHPAAVVDLGLNRHSVYSLLERIGREETHDTMFRFLKDAPDLLA
jgi:ankyrin repeat protein